MSRLPQCVRLHLSIPYRLLLGNVGCSSSTFYFSSLKSLGCTKIVIFHQFFSPVRRIRQTHSPLPSSPCVTQAFVIIARQQRSQPQPSWGQGRTGVDVISFLNVSQWWAICFPSSFTNSSLTTVFFSLFRLIYGVSESDWRQTGFMKRTFKAGCVRAFTIDLLHQNKNKLVLMKCSDQPKYFNSSSG